MAAVKSYWSEHVNMRYVPFSIELMTSSDYTFSIFKRSALYELVNYCFCTFSPELLRLPFNQSYVNPLTPGTFCKKCVFWTFWWSLGWASAKLPLTWLKMRLQHSCLPFSPPASHFSAMWLRHAQKSKFLEENVTYVLKLFDFWNFFCAFPFSPFLFFFAAVIDLLWACLRFKNLWESVIKTGSF